MQRNCPTNSNPGENNCRVKKELLTFPNQVDRDIAHRLALARKIKNWPLSKLASEAGISEDVLREIEMLEARASATVIRNIAVAVELPIAWFFGQPSRNVDLGVLRILAVLSNSAKLKRSDCAKVETLRARLNELRALRQTS